MNIKVTTRSRAVITSVATFLCVSIIIRVKLSLRRRTVIILVKTVSRIERQL